VQAPPEGFVSRYGFVLLFGTLGVFYVLAPIVHQFREGLHPLVPTVVEGLLFLGVLLAAVVSTSKGRAWIPFALLLGLPAVALWLVGLFVVAEGIALASQMFLAVFLGYTIAVMLEAIFTSRRVTFNTVCASLCVYLLLGLIWALAYSLVDVLDPAAFTYTVAGGKHPPLLRVGRGDIAVLYFSFTTLTTLGYGDIVPTSPVSRMLASSEAIVGQLYLAVLVARLVGMHIVHSMEQQKTGDREQIGE
jgi:hypothetical protein